MASAAIHWHQSAKARAILSSLVPQQMRLITHTPIVGPRTYEWCAGEDTDLALERVREEAIAAEFGATFKEAQASGRDGEYLDFYITVPTVADALASVLGDTPQYGSVDLIHRADWALRAATMALGERAAA